MSASRLLVAPAPLVLLAPAVLRGAPADGEPAREGGQGAEPEDEEAENRLAAPSRSSRSASRSARRSPTAARSASMCRLRCSAPARRGAPAAVGEGLVGVAAPGGAEGGDAVHQARLLRLLGGGRVAPRLGDGAIERRLAGRERREEVLAPGLQEAAQAGLLVEHRRGQLLRVGLLAERGRHGAARERSTGS